ncbi:GTP cyclohydrolase II [Candidatus Methylospira mobilis]|uniref:GTP cyclohydrolase-2 n=1 Tax=Candidatus Methylospira mobilis TaxID=1808979 RepID=A0A5Q0BM08_9GAMM|nr:GTP cyclohydrolase II [Candidatus Methylospira mobilis]QFY43254.1 GTP cyclohydrolase II [Candidatus Methylospira mobilis]WNV03547.1 GTP cyclohydrolase II [Candidatus Methylospira mobilis]
MHANKIPEASAVVTDVVSARLPTRYGEFALHYYANSSDKKEHLALVMGDVSKGENILVRAHSECLTGDIFGSMRCDCGDQLDKALAMIGQEGKGALIYLRQEGRGIGLLKKLQAYNLQDSGLDTVEANLHLGHREDERDYAIAAAILKALNIASVRLITNNPLKLEALRALGIQINGRVALEIAANTENADYLRTKAEKMRHWLSVPAAVPAQKQPDRS